MKAAAQFGDTYKMQLDANENLDSLIREEKHRVAQEFFQDAWKNAVNEGIEPSILAESALVTVLTELHSADGEHPVAEIVEALPARLECGHFIADIKLQ